MKVMLTSDVDLLRDLKGIIDLNAEAAKGARDRRIAGHTFSSELMEPNAEVPITSCAERRSAMAWFEAHTLGLTRF